jgi:hypothetical protein
MAATTYSGRTCSALGWPSGEISLSRTICVAVAQVEEDQIAVIAAAVDPAHERNGLAGVGGAEFAAGVGALMRA